MSFVIATRKKLRFETDMGLISVEDLWDLPLTSAKRTSLDSIAVSLNKKINDNATESFVETSVFDSSEDRLKFDVVKFIIDTKIKERDEAKSAAVKKAKREELLSILASKERDELHDKSADEIRRMIDAL